MSTDNIDDINELEAKKNYLEEWLARHKKAQHIAPQVQINLELTEWQLRALRDRPKEADEIPLVDMGSQLRRERDFLSRALPMMPIYDVNAIDSSTALSSSGTADLYSYIARVGDLESQEARRYSLRHTTAYNDLQEEQERPKAVRRLLIELGNKQIVDRFDRAMAAFLATKRGSGERTSASMEMRTLLDGIKGELFAKARTQPKENMTWGRMAERLAKGGPGRIEYQELIARESVNSSLVNRLSQVGKDREGLSYANINVLWTELLDHIFIVLGLVKKRRTSGPERMGS